MALITRVTRLFRADLHAVLDRIEEPEALLRQSMREMEQALEDDRGRAALLRREHARLDARSSDLERTLHGVAEELDVCFDCGEDELARALVRKQLEAQRLRDSVARRREGIAGDLATLEARIADNAARLRDLGEKAEVLADVEREPETETARSETAVHAHEVEVAFLREKQRRLRS